MTRAALIATLRNRVEWDHWPRFTVTFMLAFAGLAAFVSSVVMLQAGLDSMAWRYGLAAAGGYAVFLGLVRLWIAAQRGWSPDGDLGVDLTPDAICGIADAPGALGRIADVHVAGGSFDLDLDDLFALVLVLLLVLGGLAAIAYVVYVAPALLAEVMLDAALVGSVSARLKAHEAQWWASGVVSRTAVPASALVLCVALAGFVFELVAPEARSIGGVIRGVFG